MSEKVGFPVLESSQIGRLAPKLPGRGFSRKDAFVRKTLAPEQDMSVHATSIVLNPVPPIKPHYQDEEKYIHPAEIENFLGTNLGDLKTTANSLIDVAPLAKIMAHEIQDIGNNEIRLTAGKVYTFYRDPEQIIAEKKLAIKFPKATSKQIKIIQRNMEKRFIDLKEARAQIRDLLVANFTGDRSQSFDIEQAVNSLAEPEEIKLPVDMIINKTPKGDTEFEIIGGVLAKGSFRTVSASKFITIKPKLQDHQLRCISSETVTGRFQNPAAATRVSKANSMVRTRLEKEIAAGQAWVNIPVIEGRAVRKGSDVTEDRAVRHLGTLTSVELSPTQKFRVLLDLGQTLLEFHKNGLIHRDVKPENVLVSKQYRGLLSDLETVTEKNGKLSFAGTIAYADILSLEGQTSAFTDIYSYAKTILVVLGVSSPTDSDEAIIDSLSKSSAIPAGLAGPLLEVFKLNHSIAEEMNQVRAQINKDLDADVTGKIEDPNAFERAVLAKSSQRLAQENSTKYEKLLDKLVSSIILI